MSETHTDEEVSEIATAEQPRVWVPALKEAASAFALAAICLLVVYTLFFRQIHPEFVRFMDPQDVPTILIKGNQFSPVQVGNGGYEGGAAIVTEYRDGAAILEVNTAFAANDYPFIKFDIELTDILFNKLKNIIYNCKDNTCGPRSISKQELIKEFNKLF